MGRREAKVVTLVQRNPGITPEELAERLGVSLRTVRNWVRQANDSLGTSAHLSLARGSGYTLSVTDDASFGAWLDEEREQVMTSVPETQADRVSYLLGDLLERSDWITIDELASVLFVSRNIVSSDLRQVDATLGRFGLVLERRPHYGIRVTGPESARRACMTQVALSQLKDLPSSVSDVLASDDGDGTIQVVQSCVDDALAASGFSVNPISYQNLIVHIAMALVRIEEGCYVPSSLLLAQEAADNARAHEVAQLVAHELGDRLGVMLPAEEVDYMAIHLASKEALPSPDGSEDEQGIVISDEVWGVVSEMLDVVWESYHFDLSDDLELRMNLARHIVPLSVRLAHNMELENPMLGDIKAHFPFAYSMAVDSSHVITRIFGGTLSEAELGYIALSFALALERRRTERAKKNILVVCASGVGTARIVSYRCRREFGDYLGEVRTCDVSHVASQDFSTIDYVFSAVPIVERLPVPVLSVRAFFDPEELAPARELIQEPRQESGFLSYFSPDLFLTHLSYRSKRRALDDLIAHLMAVRPVDERFGEQVWGREKVAPTAFGNGVAMPHPLVAQSDETYVCVGLLDKPLNWGSGGEVRAIFLISYSRDGGPELDLFFDALARLFLDSDSVSTLVSNQSWETLKALIEKNETREGGVR